VAARDLTPSAVAPLPPLRTYGCVILIDDDADYVRTLEDVLSFRNFGIETFTDPAALHASVGQRVSAFSQEQAFLSEVWRAQLEASGTAAEKALAFFASPHRLHMPLVLVSDYAMPAETGVSLCSRPEYSAVERVLLTGVADNGIAVSAFNAGAIDQFVQKQGASFPTNIVNAVEGRLLASAVRRAAQLSHALPPDLSSVLSSGDTSATLDALLHAHDVCEYMMLGQPQGIVGITSKGDALWIQLETASSLQDLDDVLELAKAPPAVRTRVGQRKSLIAPDFMKQICAEPTERPSQVLSRNPLLLAAVHPLTVPARLRPCVPGRA
jgi:DNA-binding NarL/FixJ family response regulator